VQNFLGYLNYITNFILQLIVRCEPLFHFLHKKNSGVWDDDYQKALDKIKIVLIESTSLSTTFAKKTIYLVFDYE